ncbi:hypothetical protein WICMUC_002019 [Wickerhamomyces mucosus]|uniref:Mitochondrial carrier protein n=1 Tax=Wickerhamomyces mucosus TaxID=1378264 RepID=A0A9P8PQD8_9ASCO|nr:hypothetical protein WICMUC_002019 [Wickerhamomyces mucosus]
MSEASKPKNTAYEVVIGYVAGIFSGVSKNAVGHPLDTIKVRLQTDNTKFKGPIDCVYQTFKTQGIKGFYLGFTPPLVGWVLMDSVMLGSLHNYRRLIKKHLYEDKSLDLKGHIFAGVLAGWTVSFIAAPVEYAKVKLQIQYGDKNRGPISVIKGIYAKSGLGINGLYKGLVSTLIFRTHFITWWGSYHIFTDYMHKNCNFSPVLTNFLAGGFSASCFWITAYPFDVVKSYVLANDKFNGSLKSWKEATLEIYQTKGLKGFGRGFVPSILRAFPANAAALAAFEGVLRLAGTTSHH